MLVVVFLGNEMKWNVLNSFPLLIFSAKSAVQDWQNAAYRNNNSNSVRIDCVNNVINEKDHQTNHVELNSFTEPSPETNHWSYDDQFL